MPQMTITSIVREPDRAVLYGSPEYYVIAASDVDIVEGDTITYESYGVNFGWFVSIADPEKL